MAPARIVSAALSALLMTESEWVIRELRGEEACIFCGKVYRVREGHKHFERHCLSWICAEFVQERGKGYRDIIRRVLEARRARYR